MVRVAGLVVAALLFFAVFLGGGVLVAVIAFPAIDLLTPAESKRRERYHTLMRWAFRAFIGMLTWLRVIEVKIDDPVALRGSKGVIVVDTLTSIEGARAAMQLYFKHRGKRPVTAVIFTHTHTDHWGGARGVLDDSTLASATIPIIAPNLFMEHAVSETSLPALRCCAARNISSGRCWPRGRAARSIAGSASRWRQVRWRCCARPI